MELATCSTDINPVFKKIYRIFSITKVFKQQTKSTQKLKDFMRKSYSGFDLNKWEDLVYA